MTQALRLIWAGLLLWLVAVLGLLASGAVLSIAQEPYQGPWSYFVYRVRCLDYLPAWLASVHALTAINGLGLIQAVGRAGFHFGNPYPAYPGHPGMAVTQVTPVIRVAQLIAVNLVAVPALIGLYLLVRAMLW